MKIVIVSGTTTPPLFSEHAADCITARTVEELQGHRDADLFIDLDFERHDGKAGRDARIAALSVLLPTPIMINAVIHTLADIERPFIRINGWPGFTERPIHELVAPDQDVTRQIGEWYEKLGHSCRLVPDIPGMITARILVTIINEAWYTWEAGVSTKEEIDTAMKLGTNYPYGPFEWGQRIGLARIVSLLNVLSVANARYTPANSLQQAVTELKCD
jgi:3-hydroxybutyryl-CoA dehydrogenase